MLEAYSTPGGARDMKEILKVIVAKMNAMFNTDYNLISFDTLSIEDLHQILCDVITHLGGFEKWDYKKQPQEVILKVFQSLSAINYVPYKDNNTILEPDIFREKLIAGERNVVHQILFFLISNEQQCKKLLYLSKYIKEIPVPAELIDEQFTYLKEEYDRARDQFWSVYKENKKTFSEAQASDELREDIERMNKDIGNLSLRIEQQKEKLDSVPQKAVYMEQAKQLRGESTQQKKLQEQVRETQQTVDRLTDLRTTLEGDLQSKKMDRKNYANLISATREEISVKNIMFANELPKQLENSIKDVKLYEIISNEYIPHKEDLEELEIKVERAEEELRTLVERKNLLIHSTEDKLGPFRNQAKVIANKKMENAGVVHQLKEMISEIDASIEEKTRFMHELVGGTILHGTDLKMYVNSLRNQSNHYKACRNKLQSLNYEISVLNRSLDIIYLMGSNVEEDIKNKNYPIQSNVEALDDINDIKLRCRKLKGELDQFVAMHVTTKEELASFTRNIGGIEEIYLKSKQDFQDATGIITDEINRLKAELDKISRSVKEKEDNWKQLNTIIEKNEQTLEQLLTSSGPSTVKEKLSKRIDELKVGLESATEQLAEGQRIMKEDITTIESLKDAFNIISCKSQQETSLRPIKTELKTMHF